jgi:hypothetical protein
MKTKTLLALCSAAFLSILVLSCKYDEMLPYEPDPTIPVYFSADIIPIFNASCNGSGCHNGSGPAPDLRAESAYDALWDGGYIDVVDPPNSELYLWMRGERGFPMPLTGSNATYNSTVLSWIEQGALNN